MNHLKEALQILAQEEDLPTVDDVADLGPPEEGGRTVSKDDILDWFRKNPDPSDADVHEWAEEMGFDTSALEGAIYGIVTDHVTMLEEMEGEYE